MTFGVSPLSLVYFSIDISQLWKERVVTTKAGPWLSEVLLVENLKKVEQFEKLENLKKVGKLEKKVGKIE